MVISNITINLDALTCALIERLILEDHELTDAEVTQCLEFVYSHLVNKFQGDLAESAATKLCADLERKWKRTGLLPKNAQYIAGNILEKSLAIRTNAVNDGWKKGADGLFVVKRNATRETKRIDAPTLHILGVVEVKSYTMSYERASSQIEKHILRLRHGLKIGKRYWPPERLFYEIYDAVEKKWKSLPISAKKRPRLIRVLIKPKPAKMNNAKNRKLPPLAHECILPHARNKYASEAYELTVRYLEQLGAKVFTKHPNPWPELTVEGAGINAVKQALYFVMLRDLQKRQHRIAARLYNVYGFGYDNAEGRKNMLWSVRGRLVSDEKSDGETSKYSASSLSDRMDSAWAHYRTCEMQKALDAIDAALSMNPDEQSVKRLHRLQGLIHYSLADFTKAAEVFPRPDVAQTNDWWHRDRLTLAKIYLRLNRLDEAVRVIVGVERAGRKDLALPIALPACEAMVLIKRGENEAALQRLNNAYDALRQLIASVNDRRQRTLGDPLYFNPASAYDATFDTATGFAMADDLKSALNVFMEVHGDVFPPTVTFLKLDPALEKLRNDDEHGARFNAWLYAKINNI